MKNKRNKRDTRNVGRETHGPVCPFPSLERVKTLFLFFEVVSLCGTGKWEMAGRQMNRRGFFKSFKKMVSVSG